jgi:acylglycerol lipase
MWNAVAAAHVRLYYLLKYPPTSSAIKIRQSKATMDLPPPTRGNGKGYDNAERQSEEKHRPDIAGAFVFCPMVEGE